MNNFAISSAGIGDALQRSASALAAAGNSMEESIGMITAMNSVMQNPEAVGTAMKSLSMYLRAAKTEAEEAGISTDGMAESVSELRGELLALTGQKLDIMLDDDTFKSTFQIMEELSQIWGELTDITQSNILNLIAGKRNANAVTALLTNFKDAQAAAETAMNSMGSAYLENEKYLDSIAGKISQAKAQFEAMSNSIVSSGAVSFFVDLSSAVMSVVTALSDAGLLIPGILVAISAINGMSNLNTFNELTASMGVMLKQGDELGDIATSLAGSFSKLTGRQKDTVVETLKASAAFNALDNVEKKNILTKLGYKAATDAATASNVGFGASLKSLLTATNPFLLAITGITIVTTAVVAITNAVKKAREQTIEAAKEIRESFAEAEEAYNNNSKSLKDLEDRFRTLSMGVDSNGKNISLTADEYAEYLSIVDKIVAISPDVVIGYTAEGMAIASYTTLLQDAIDKQNELYESQKKTYLAGGDEIFEGAKTSYEDALKEIEDLSFDLFEDISFGMVQDGDMVSALQSIGLTPDGYSDFWGDYNLNGWAEDYETVAQTLIQNRDALLHELSKSDHFDSEDIGDLEELIFALDEYNGMLEKAKADLADYLYGYFDYTAIEEYAAAWDALPDEMLPRMRDAFAEVIDFSATKEENIANAKAVVDAIVATYEDAEIGTQIKELSEQAGEITDRGDVATYNKEVDALVSKLRETNPVVADMVYTYLMGLTSSSRVVSEFGGQVQTVAAGVTGLADSLKALADGNELKIQALGDMAADGLTTETIQSIMDFLPEGEPLSKYITEENGRLSLAIDEWDRLTQRLAMADIKAIESHLTELEAERDAIESMTGYVPVETSERLLELNTAIEQYTGDLSVYYAALDQAATDSARSIDGTLSAAKAARSEAEGVLSALSTVKGGDALTRTERLDLIIETPELADLGFIDAETAAQQKEILDAMVADMEAAYDQMLQVRIDALENETSAIDASTAAGEAELAQLEAKMQLLRSMQDEGLQIEEEQQVFGLDGAVESANAGMKAIELYKTACEELAAAGNISVETFEALRELTGSEALFAGLFDAAGNLIPENILDFGTEEMLDGLSVLNREYDNLTANGEQNTAAAMANRAAYAILRDVLIQVADAMKGVEPAPLHESISKAVDAASKIDDVMQQVKEDMAEYGYLLPETIGKVAETFGEEFERVTNIDSGGNLQVLEEEVEAVKREQIAATGVSEEYSQAILDNGASALNAANSLSKFEEMVNAVRNGMDNVGLAGTVFEEIAESGRNEIDTLMDIMEEFPDIAGDIIDWDAEGGPIADIERLKAAIADAVMAAAEIDDPAIKEAIVAQLDLIGQETDTYGDLTAALEKADEAMDSFRQAREEMAEGGLTTGTITDIAEQLSPGEHISDYIYVSDGEIRLNEQAWMQRALAIEESKLAELEAIDTTKMSSAELEDHQTKLAIQKAKLLEVGEAAREMSAEMADAFADASAAAAQLGKVEYGEQLTHDEYMELIGFDKRYVDAVEYQNGVMTLNTSKHAEITNAIAEETIAMAEAEIAAIMMSDEYKELISAVGDLDDAQQARLDQLNVEIMTYATLANELQNATDWYARFKNAAKPSKSDRYSEGINAFETVKGVLYDKKSDMYGRKGTEGYRIALEFFPEVDPDSPEWDAAYKQVERYFTDGSKGVERFWQDLTKYNLRDKVTGDINTTIAEIAQTLNISETAVRALIDEVNTYLEEPIQVKADTSAVEDELANIESSAEGAASGLGGVGEAADEQQETLTSLESRLAEVRQDIERLSSTPVDIRTGGSVGRVGSVSNAISTLINRLNTLARNSSVNIRITETTTKINRTINLGGAKTGTSSASGTNSAIGGRTLVGELGMETVVDPQTNKWYTVGNHGAEFVNLPQGAIVFNADQTRELFGKGSTGGRGQAMLMGNAALSAVNADVAGAKNHTSKLSGVINGIKNIGKNIGNAITKGLNAVGDFVSDAAKTVTQTNTTKSDTTTGTNTPSSLTGGSSGSSSGSGKGSGGGGSSSSSSKKDTEKLEELKEKYEELNKQLEHLIKHQEFLYQVAEKAYDYKGMEKSLAEQSSLYAQIMKNTQAAIKEMQAKGADDTSEELQAMEEAYWSAYNSFYETLNEINVLYTDAINSKIDDLQTAYSNLQAAADEFAAGGGISVDTFQNLLESGIQYMSILEEVNGQYVINKDALDDLIAAEKEQLAVEGAISYLTQLQTALTEKDSNAVKRLVNLTQQIGDSTWDVVKAQLALIKSLGLTDEQYEQVVQNVQAFKDLAGSVITDITKGTEDIATDANNALRDQESALGDILSLTEDLIKYETEERINAIEDQIDAYKEIINLKKEALKTTKDENDYESQVAEKTKEIAELQAKIDLLSLDTSNEARAERASLQDEMNKLLEDLADYQDDHAYDVQIDALDKMEEDYEESRQGEIEELEDSISSAEKLYQLAIKRINEHWDTLYEDLIAWNTKAGNSLNSEITEQWELAAEAVKKYGSYLEALEGIKTGVEVEEDKVNNVVGDASTDTGSSIRPPEEEEKEPVEKEPSFFDKIAGVIKDAVGDKNPKLDKEVDAGGIIESIKGSEAIKEIYANAQNSLGSVLEKFGNVTTKFGIDLNKIQELQQSAANKNNSFIFNPEMIIEITGAGKMDEQQAEIFGESIANSTISKLQEALALRGISSSYAAGLFN